MSKPSRRRITITSRITIRFIATVTGLIRWLYPLVGADTGMAVGTVAVGTVAAGTVAVGMVVRLVEDGTVAGLVEDGMAAGIAEIIHQ